MAITETTITLPQGRSFDLRKPDPRDVRAGDIVTSLGIQIRYLGHQQRITVLEHSLWVAQASIALAEYYRWSEEEISSERLWAHAMIHDAHEAYIGDIISPVASAIHMMCGASDVIHRLKSEVQSAIEAAAGLQRPTPKTIGIIARADHASRAHEAWDTFRGGVPQYIQTDLQIIRRAKPVSTLSAAHELEAVFRKVQVRHAR